MPKQCILTRRTWLKRKVMNGYETRKHIREDNVVCRVGTVVYYFKLVKKTLSNLSAIFTRRFGQLQIVLNGRQADDCRRRKIIAQSGIATCCQPAEIDQVKWRDRRRLRKPDCEFNIDGLGGL